MEATSSHQLLHHKIQTIKYHSQNHPISTSTTATTITTTLFALTGEYFFREMPLHFPKWALLDWLKLKNHPTAWEDMPTRTYPRRKVMDNATSLLAKRLHQIFLEMTNSSFPKRLIFALRSLIIFKFLFWSLTFKMKHYRT